MAVSPTIPTSFVPKQPLDAPRRKMQSGDNILLLVSLLIFAVSLVTAGAVFGYERYLTSAIEVKVAALEQARVQIDEDKVEDLVRLQERFNSGRMLLRDHIATSRFLGVLEESTLQNVRFDSMTLTVADDRSAIVSLAGTARNFNTLAVQSNEIATRRDFKRAIFSGISLNQNGTVTFTLTASIDPDLIRMETPTTTPAAPAPEAPAAPVAPPAATTTTQAATSTTAPAATTTPRL